ncbi:clustered mitochondria protein homolog [Plakobranchus ocellatus]|uniref:Clustered mitochondria protein homolog n=1 Tax=Plakobranchus ocellatus TaxID=259542 RepID=A0AAV4DBF2_9GAST|nr:clustered mitochondria protein homolog [Plakobranchus ocellatus]
MAGITASDDDRDNCQKKEDPTQESSSKPMKDTVNGHETMKTIVLDRQSVETVEEEKDGKKEDNGEKENGEIETDKEVLLIQDTGFNVKIAAPGLDMFELPVSSMELVQEIHQVLMDREDTCQRTCFSLQLDGQTLDNFSELKSIEGLKEGSTIKVVEEPYTVREARIHVRHVRDLMKSVDQADSYNGVDCSSLSFLNTITMGDILDKKRSKPDSVDCTPPDAIIPNSKDRPLLPLHPGIKDIKTPPGPMQPWTPAIDFQRIFENAIYIPDEIIVKEHGNCTRSSL